MQGQDSLWQLMGRDIQLRTLFELSIPGPVVSAYCLLTYLCACYFTCYACIIMLRVTVYGQDQDSLVLKRTKPSGRVLGDRLYCTCYA
jgi:hypothetical protein